MPARSHFTYKRAKSVIEKWMVDHNLGSKAGLKNGIISVYGNMPLVMVLNYRGNDLRYLFDSAHGGGSRHLLKDFDEEVLAPLNVHAKRLDAHNIGLFFGRNARRR